MTELVLKIYKIYLFLSVIIFHKFSYLCFLKKKY